MHPVTLCIGCVPLDEPFARTNTIPDWLWLQHLEAETYRAALIARFGLPPEGFAMDVRAHDVTSAVGTTILARFDAEDGTSLEYFEAVNGGLESWAGANFTAPVHYYRSGAERERTRRTTWDCVLEAILTSYKLVGSIEGGPIAQTVIDNLTDAFPEIAVEATARLYVMAVVGHDAR